MRTSQVEQKTRRLLALGYFVAAGAAVVFAWLAFHVARGATLSLDATVRDFVHAHSSSLLTAIMRSFSLVGEPMSLCVLALAAILGFVSRGRPREAWLFAASMIGIFFLDMGLKLLCHRARPESFFGTPLPHSYSFPSGHALYSVCFGCTLAVLLMPYVRSAAWRAAIWTGAVLLALLVGLSRIYLGVHYPSDVLGGYSAATIWVAAIGGAGRALERRRPSQGKK